MEDTTGHQFQNLNIKGSSKAVLVTGGAGYVGSALVPLLLKNYKVTVLDLMIYGSDVLKKNKVPEGVSCLINGDSNVGEWMSNDLRIPLISATGSTQMGRKVSQLVAKRLGKTLLELGGNNAIIITPSADIKMTLIAVLFGSVGTCAQRCTSTRRLIIHEDIYIKLVSALKKAYLQLKIGDPLDMKNHIGPLIDKQSVSEYLQVIEKADKEKENIKNVIWATGYVHDFSWLKVNAFDKMGKPDHYRGVSKEKGIYFLGLPWLSMRGSSFIWGVWQDAKYLGEQISKKDATINQQVNLK